MSSGVYQIKNKLNGNIYIGSTVDIERRWSEHRLRLDKRKHHSRHLQNAWNKYGADAFEFSVVELCFSFSLISREQHYIDLYNPTYNISLKAGSTLGIKQSPEARANMSKGQLGNKNKRGYKATDETRLKMSLSGKVKIFSPKHLANLKGSHKGYVTSDETRKKIAASKIGSKLSEETKAKLSAYRKLWWVKKKENQDNE